MKSRILILTFFPVLIFSIFGCKKNTLEVTKSYVGKRLEVPTSQYPTIAAALAAAKPTDTIMLDPGTYNEGIIQGSTPGGMTFNIMICSRMILKGDTSYISKTILTDNDLLTPTEVSQKGISGAYTVVGLTFKKVSVGATKIKFCRISGARADGASASEIDHCKITYNLGGVSCSRSITNSEVSYNGGGIFANGNVDVRNCLIEGNVSASGGAGLANTAQLQSIHASHCIFRNNQSTNITTDGGAIFLKDHCQMVVDSSLFEGNSSAKNGGVVAKEIAFGSSSMMFHSDTFRNNSAESGAGVIAGDSNDNFYYCTFVNNKAKAAGIGIAHNFFNCVFYNNGSSNPGQSTNYQGILSCNALFNATIYKNSVAPGNYNGIGDAIIVADSAVVNSVAWGNAPNNGCYGPSWENLHTYIFYATQIRYCDLDSTQSFTFPGNKKTVFINSLQMVDPKFQNPDNGDFHLQAGSPLIGAGDPAYPDGKGNRRNIGAY